MEQTFAALGEQLAERARDLCLEDVTGCVAIFAASLARPRHLHAPSKSFLDAELSYRFLSSSSWPLIRWLLDFQEIYITTKSATFARRAPELESRVDWTAMLPGWAPASAPEIILSRIRDRWPDLLDAYLRHFKSRWFRELSEPDCCELFRELLRLDYLGRGTTVVTTRGARLRRAASAQRGRAFILAGAMMRANIPWATLSRHNLLPGSDSRGMYILARSWAGKVLRRRKSLRAAAEQEFMEFLCGGKILTEAAPGSMIFAIPQSPLVDGTTIGPGCCSAGLILDGEFLTKASQHPEHAEQVVTLLVLDQVSVEPIRAPETSEDLARWLVTSMELYSTQTERAFLRSIISKLTQRYAGSIARLDHSGDDVAETRGLGLVLIPFFKQIFDEVSNTLLVTANHARLMNACLWLDAMTRYCPDRSACYKFCRSVGGERLLAMIAMSLTQRWSDVRGCCAEFLTQTVGWEGTCSALLVDDGRYRFLKGSSSAVSHFTQADILSWILDELLTSERVGDEDAGVSLFAMLIQELRSAASGKRAELTSLLKTRLELQESGSLWCEVLDGLLRMPKSSGLIRVIALVARELLSDPGLGVSILTKLHRELIFPTVEQMNAAAAAPTQEDASDGSEEVAFDCRGHIIGSSQSFYQCWTCARECGRLLEVIARLIPLANDDLQLLNWFQETALLCIDTLFLARHPAVLDAFSGALGALLLRCSKQKMPRWGTIPLTLLRQAVVPIPCPDLSDDILNGPKLIKYSPPPLRKSKSLVAVLRVVLPEAYFANPANHSLYYDENGAAVDLNDMVKALWRRLTRVAFSSAETAEQQAAKFHALNAVRALAVQHKLAFERIAGAERPTDDFKQLAWRQSVWLLNEVVKTSCESAQIRSAVNLCFASLQQQVTRSNLLQSIDCLGNPVLGDSELLDIKLKASGNYQLTCADYARARAHHPLAVAFESVMEACPAMLDTIRAACEGGEGATEISYALFHFVSLLRPPRLSGPELLIQLLGQAAEKTASAYATMLQAMFSFACEKPDPFYQLSIAAIYCSAIPSDLPSDEITDKWVRPILSACINALFEARHHWNVVCFTALIARGVLRLCGNDSRLLEPVFAETERVCWQLISAVPPSRPAQYLASLAAELVWVLTRNPKSHRSLVKQMQSRWISDTSFPSFKPVSRTLLAAFVRLPLCESSTDALRLFRADFTIAMTLECLQVLERLLLEKRIAPINPQDMLVLLESCKDAAVVEATLRCMALMPPTSASSRIRSAVVVKNRFWGGWRRSETAQDGERAQKYGRRRRCEYLLLHDLMQDFQASAPTSVRLLDAVVRLWNHQIARGKELTREAAAVTLTSLSRLLQRAVQTEDGLPDKERALVCQSAISALSMLPILHRQDARRSHRLCLVILPAFALFIVDNDLSGIRMPLRRALQDLVGSAGPLTTESAVNDLAVIIHRFAGGPKNLSLRHLLAGICGMPFGGTVVVAPLRGVQFSLVEKPGGSKDWATAAFDDDAAVEDAAHLLQCIMAVLPPTGSKYCSWDDNNLVRATTQIAEAVQRSVAAASSSFTTFRYLSRPELMPTLMAARAVDMLLGLPGSGYSIDT